MRRLLLVLVAPIAACLASAIGAIATHESDPAFALSQEHLHRLAPGAVDALVSTAPDPRDQRRVDGAARCGRSAGTDLGNPWTCAITYRGGFKTRYAVTISRSGSYAGKRLDVPGEITGCCLRRGALP